MDSFLHKMFGTNDTLIPKRIPASSEGIAVAYTSLTAMALLPIFFGSKRSVKYHKGQQKLVKEKRGKAEILTHKDAAIFPLVASCALLGLYILFQIFSKEYINLLLTFYFVGLGILSQYHLMEPITSFLLHKCLMKKRYRLTFTAGKGSDKNVIFDIKFTSYDIFCIVGSSLIGCWYITQKHWIANNVFGIGFAVSGVEILQLNNVQTGCILLGGLFIYDVFWVFGTNVMVTVAKSFEAPIKLVFPQDLLEKGLTGTNFAMLGLGDVVIPGLFIALLLRFDNSLKRNSQTYFYTTFMAYIAGLLLTIFFMTRYNHAQPALLYLVPTCVGTPLLLALIRGDLKELLQYEDTLSNKTKKLKHGDNLGHYQSSRTLEIENKKNT